MTASAAFSPSSGSVIQTESSRRSFSRGSSHRRCEDLRRVPVIHQPIPNQPACFLWSRYSSRIAGCADRFAERGEGEEAQEEEQAATAYRGDNSDLIKLFDRLNQRIYDFHS